MRAALWVEVSAAAKRGDLPSLSLPESKEFVTNNRGQRIHVRTSSATPGLKAKGLVVFVHGIGAHCSRANWTYLARAFNHDMGMHYAALDFAGHGYSQGDKGLISSPDDLLDDLSSFLDALYRTPTSNPATTTTTTTTNASLDLEPLDASTPFFLLGNSMGGAVALLLAHRVTVPGAQQPWRAAFKGCILSAPALHINKPAAPILFLLDWVVAPLLPMTLVPSVFSSSKPDSFTWELEEYGVYVSADPLSRSGPLMFRTAQSIVQLVDAVREAMPAMSNGALRLLVLMDPDDQVCLFSGVELLQEVAPIAATTAGGVKVVPMPGARHDVLCNRMDEAVEVMQQWLMQQECLKA